MGPALVVPFNLRRTEFWTIDFRDSSEHLLRLPSLRRDDEEPGHEDEKTDGEIRRRGEDFPEEPDNGVAGVPGNALDGLLRLVVFGEDGSLDLLHERSERPDGVADGSEGGGGRAGAGVVHAFLPQLDEAEGEGDAGGGPVLHLDAEERRGFSGEWVYGGGGREDEPWGLGASDLLVLGSAVVTGGVEDLNRLLGCWRSRDGLMGEGGKGFGE